MKYLVVVGDLHLHPHKAFAHGHGRFNSRFRTTLRSLEVSLTKARELSCPWIQPGDWFHSIGFVQNFVLNELISLLNQFEDVEKWTTWGNHDARSAGSTVDQMETAVHALVQSVKSLYLLDQPPGVYRLTSNGLTIFGEGFQPNVKDLTIAAPPPNAVPYDVGVFHQTVVGSRLPGGMKADWGLPADWLFRSCKLAIVGDVHEPQILVDKETSHVILVPGSLEAHNFGDQSARGWWIVKWNESHIGPQIQLDMEWSASPRFVTVDKVDEVKTDGNFYRILSPTPTSELPDGAVAVSAPPVSVVQRNTFSSGFDSKTLLTRWVEILCPSFDSSIHSSEFIQAGIGLLEADAAVELKDIRLIKVQMENFLCYENTQLDFLDGITLVLGEGCDYESNGAGKTTLFESLFWVLFGRTTKGLSSDEIIRRSTDAAVVTLLFTRRGEDMVQVRRSRVRGGGTHLEVCEVAGDSRGSSRSKGQGVWGGTQKEVTDQLKSYLGLTPELFQALAYFSQSKLILFSQATDSERKEMLADLCGLDLYQNAAAAARTAVSQSVQEIAKISAAIPSTEQLVQSTFAHAKNLQVRYEDWEVMAHQKQCSISEELKTINENLLGLDVKWQEFIEKQTLYCIRREGDILQLLPLLEEKFTSNASSSLTQAEEDFNKWEKSVSTLPSFEIAVIGEKVLREELTTVNKELNALTRSIDTIVRNIDEVRTRIKELRHQSALCPTCGNPIDPVKKANLLDDLESMELTYQKDLHKKSSVQKALGEKLQELQILFLSATDLAKECEKKERDGKTWEESLNRLRKLVSQHAVQKAKEEIESKILVLRTKVESRRKILQMAISNRQIYLHDRAQRLKKELEELARNPYAVDLDTAMKNLTTHKNLLSSQQTQKKGLEDHKTLMEYWSAGFSRSGIQSLLIDEIAAAFNAARSKVFPLLTSGIYDVQFSTTSETKSGDSREKTDFLIWYHGVLVSYESLSGGQRRRIDLGVMLSLVLAVSQTRGVSGILGLLVLDEVTAFLDGDGVESLYQVLLEINKIIPNIFVITHDASLQSLFGRTILVQQNEYGTSSLTTAT